MTEPTGQPTSPPDEAEVWALAAALAGISVDELLAEGLAVKAAHYQAAARAVAAGWTRRG